MKTQYFVVFTADAVVPLFRGHQEVPIPTKEGVTLRALRCTSVTESFGGLLELIPAIENPQHQQEMDGAVVAAVYVNPRHVLCAMRMSVKTPAGFEAAS